jgi:hypothetical protein
MLQCLPGLFRPVSLHTVRTPYPNNPSLYCCCCAGVRTVRSIEIELCVLYWHALSAPLCHFETTDPPGPQLCFIQRADLRRGD